jgi:hypothetical protein
VVVGEAVVLAAVEHFRTAVAEEAAVVEGAAGAEEAEEAAVDTADRVAISS